LYIDFIQPIHDKKTLISIVMTQGCHKLFKGPVHLNGGPGGSMHYLVSRRRQCIVTPMNTGMRGQDRGPVKVTICSVPTNSSSRRSISSSHPIK